MGPHVRPFCTHVLRKIGDASPVSVANMLWAAARCDLYEPALFQYSFRAVSSRLHEFSVLNVTNCLWAFGRLVDARGD